MSRLYPPAGVCIYCGATENLGDEHIIPLALSGNWVLPKASCQECAAITSAVERAVLRGPLWPSRIALGLRTRRPKQQPKTFPMTLRHSDASTTCEQVPTGMHPATVLLPMFARPAAFELDPPYPAGVRTTGFYIGHLRPHDELLSAYGAVAATAEVMYPAVEFARLVAKIGFAFAAAELGYQRVRHSVVRSAVLGETLDVGAWVGCHSDVAMAPAAPGSLHAAAVLPVPGVAVAVQLFCVQPAPVYVVLVGSPSSAELQTTTA